MLGRFWESPFLLVVTVLVVIVGFPLLGPLWENGHFFWNENPLDNT